jgi:predicted AAA+ superfamily ATPase
MVRRRTYLSCFRGAFCENFVAQEFLYSGSGTLYAWAGATAEVEFLREVDGGVCPIEVKAGLSGKLKSLNVFADKYPTRCCVRISARNLEINNEANMHSYPLYLTYRFPL